MNDLAMWLLAQYDADEQRAEDLRDRRTCDMYSYDPKCCDCDYPDELRDDLAAKRRIVEEHRPQVMPVLEVRGETVMSGPECRTCADWDKSDMDGPPPVAAPCRTLRLLAQPYADREGYDPSWRIGS